MTTATRPADEQRDRIDRDLIRRYRQDGDHAARDRVVERTLPLVRSIARGYRDRGEDLDDLVQAGSLGLVKAVERFDPDAGTRFISYAAPTISGEIKRHFRDHTWAVHVPRSVQELGLKVQHETRRAVERTGRDPTHVELADRLRTTPADIAEAVAGTRAYRPTTLDETTDPWQTGREDPGYARVDDRDLLDWAARPLQARTRRMVRDRFLDDLVQREIATEHHLSPMAVSRVLAKALADMHDRLCGGEPDTARRTAPAFEGGA